MNVLFVGGPKHGKIMSLTSGKIPMERYVVACNPDDKPYVFTGLSAIVNHCKPADMPTYETFIYILRRVIVSDAYLDFDANKRLAYVYFSSRIKREHYDLWLSADSFIVTKLRKLV